MSGRIIDGRALAGNVRAKLASQIERLHEGGTTVRLDAILVGRDGGAVVYAANQARACRELGIEHVLHELPADAGDDEIAGRVMDLNADPHVHAIMIHLPLPPGVDTERIESLIAVDKDVEGVNPANIGNIVYGRRSLVPCTALAVMEMIESTGIDLPGTQCVCVGASNIVGKPVVVLLMRDEATVISTNKYTSDLGSDEATVLSTNKYPSDLGSITRTADVLISAAGKPGLITADMVKRGAVVIDVGITRVTADDGRQRTVGDVAFDEVSEVASAVSPVPGGVGPMTVAMLLRNTVESASRKSG